MSIEDTLAERGKTYGPFLDKAKTVQALIDVVIHEPGWERLAADQKQCIMVCFDKFARAIHGDPNHRDNFHDIVGYAKLVDDRMAADEAAEIADISRAIDGDAAALARSLEKVSFVSPPKVDSAHAGPPVVKGYTMGQSFLLTEQRREYLRGQLMLTPGNLHGKIAGDWQEGQLPPNLGSSDVWGAHADGAITAPGQIHTKSAGAVYWALP